MVHDSNCEPQALVFVLLRLASEAREAGKLECPRQVDRQPRLRSALAGGVRRARADALTDRDHQPFREVKQLSAPVWAWDEPDHVVLSIHAVLGTHQY